MEWNFPPTEIWPILAKMSFTSRKHGWMDHVWSQREAWIQTTDSCSGCSDCGLVGPWPRLLTWKDNLYFSCKMSDKMLEELIWLPAEFRSKQKLFHIKLVFLIGSVLGRQRPPPGSEPALQALELARRVLEHLKRTVNKAECFRYPLSELGPLWRRDSQGSALKWGTELLI